MSYQSLAEAVAFLENSGELIRVTRPVDGCLELAEIQRRAYKKGSPAILFESVRGSRFPVLTNLFGSEVRAAKIFGKSLGVSGKIVGLKANPSALRKMSLPDIFSVGTGAFASLPKKISAANAPVLKNRISVEDLPKIKCWPDDGGHFITLPQVYTEDPANPGIMKSNLGMYRIQLDGNQYLKNREIGVHYQIHRSIGVHHAAALSAGKELKVSIFVGGHPAHTLAAIMPLPEGLSELLFAGMLGGRRFRYTLYDGYTVSADADFCILGTIGRQVKPEGPFGDHLGYYSLTHLFPVMNVEHVFHRDDAIWPHTVVGRPPQEDTTFGKLIHTITEPMVPKTLPGVKAIHAVDEAGVHPLMLAVGTERYTPYEEDDCPREILTQACSLLGFGQCSLAKYLLIASDHPGVPDVNEVRSFIGYMLEHADFTRDLHFLTRTNMDTLDYSGGRLNSGSKLIVAASSKLIQPLSDVIPAEDRLPAGLNRPRLVSEGIAAFEATAYPGAEQAAAEIEGWCGSLEPILDKGIRLVVLTDDSGFISEDYANFLWAAFTKSDPASDIHGISSFMHNKHWGCRGALVLDARSKPHHAPDLTVPDLIAVKADDFFSSAELQQKLTGGNK